MELYEMWQIGCEEMNMADFDIPYEELEEERE